MKKLCVLFPGIGYHCDKPLLYYTNKLAGSLGYEVIPLKFAGFDKAGDAGEQALGFAEEQLSGVDFGGYDRVVFVGKSIGTVACLAYREKRAAAAEAVLLTPLTQTFGFPAQDCTAFHGTADQWAATADIERLCAENGVILHEYPGANHSLETGDTLADIAAIADVMAGLKDILSR